MTYRCRHAVVREPQSRRQCWAGEAARAGVVSWCHEDLLLNSEQSNGGGGWLLSRCHVTSGVTITRRRPDTQATAAQQVTPGRVPICKACSDEWIHVAGHDVGFWCAFYDGGLQVTCDLVVVGWRWGGRGALWQFIHSGPPYCLQCWLTLPLLAVLDITPQSHSSNPQIQIHSYWINSHIKKNCFLTTFPLQCN